MTEIQMAVAMSNLSELVRRIDLASAEALYKLRLMINEIVNNPEIQETVRKWQITLPEPVTGQEEEKKG